MRLRLDVWPESDDLEDSSDLSLSFPLSDDDRAGTSSESSSSSLFSCDDGAGNSSSSSSLSLSLSSSPFSDDDFRTTGTPLRRGHVDIQISGSRCFFCLSLQWSKRRNTSPMRSLDGSAQRNPSGAHSGWIQEFGSLHSFDHEIVTFCFFDTYSRHLCHICIRIIRENHTKMSGAISSEHRLYSFGLIAVILSDCWKLWTSIIFSCDGNRSSNSLCTTFLSSLDIIYERVNAESHLFKFLRTSLKACLSKFLPLLPKRNSPPIRA